MQWTRSRVPAWLHLVALAVVAAVVLALVEMTLEAALGSEGFWGLLVYIAAALLRDLQAVPSPPGFLPGAIVLGALLHIGISLSLSTVFVLLAPRWTDRRGILGLAGLSYGAGVFAVMWALVLPVVDPVMLRLAPLPYLVAHLAWGLVVGVWAVGVAARLDVQTRRGVAIRSA